MKQSKNKSGIWMNLLRVFPIASICIIYIIVSSLTLGATSSDDVYVEQTIKIRNVKEFQKFVENCSLDSWSLHKKIVLEADLDFTGVEITPIPAFGGVFDGNGHVISGLHLTESISPAGLFGLVQRGAVVKNLQVIGEVAPSGTANNIGGIVGINEGSVINCSMIGSVIGKNSVGGIVGFNKYTGIVQNCRAEGSVIGENRTGGIAGYNQGIIEKCKNDMSVNNRRVDPMISVDDLNFGTITDVTQLNNLEVTDVADDVGGVAGYSIGKILECQNWGTVGYDHIGYNIGGIAGRSCGYIYACRNEGAVSGRKDVGGIIGQMEPYIQVTLTESGIAKIKQELDDLNSLLDTAEKHLDSSTYKAEKELRETRTYLEKIEKILEEDQQDSYLQGMELTDAITKVYLMAARLEVMGTEMISDAGVLGRDLTKISQQSLKLSETLEGVQKELENTTISDYAADTSHINIEEIIYGKVINNTNRGKIYGDSYVGGIAGNMAPDDELDPEDEVNQNITLAEDRKYEAKAVIIKGVNEGTVVAKKDFVGGICGHTDMGIIIDCEGYGTIYSEAGEYVGGIAGLNGSKIQSCFAKSALSGSKYVGGITGGSIAENVSGEYSLVAGCYAMVDILDCQQFFGAIAGVEGGEYSDCYFVSDTLQGINRVSYSGKAEPITYKELQKVKGLPEVFERFTLTFLDGEKVIYATEFEYGQSFGEDIFPIAIGKDGKEIRWDQEELKKLKKDTVVNAVYDPYTTAVASELLRADGRPVFLAEGQFYTDTELQIEQKEVNYTSENNAFMKMFYRFRTKEQWKVKLPEDSLLMHGIRYLPADNFAGDIELYVKQDGKWKAADWEQKGSYLQFYIAGNEAEVAVVTIEGLWQTWLLYGISICVLVGGAIWMIRKNRKILKVLLWILAAVILAVAVLLAAILLKDKWKQGAEAYRILKNYIEQPEQAMNLDLEIKMGEEEHAIDIDIFCTELEGKKVTCIGQSGISLFYADGILFLDNGKAFKTGEMTADYGNMLEQLMALYDDIDIEIEKDGENTSYTITVKEESMQEITDYIMASAEGNDFHAEKMKVTLRTDADDLIDVTFVGNGSQDDETYKVTAVLTPAKIKDGRIDIPDEVKQAVLSENPKVEDVVTDDVFRLYAAWKNLFEKNPLGMQIYLQADCGPLSLEEDVTLISVMKEDLRINCLQKNDYKVFFTEDTVCSEKGYAVTASKAEAVQVANLLSVAYELCLNGTFTGVKADETYIYTLALEEESMQKIAEMITTESIDKGVQFENGSIRIRITDGNAESIQFTCDGILDVLLTEVPVAFSANLDVIEEVAGFAVPERVLETLSDER